MGILACRLYPNVHDEPAFLKVILHYTSFARAGGRACRRNACIRLSERFGFRGDAMEVENVSTSMTCKRAPKRTESLMLSQVRSVRAGKTSVMENRPKGPRTIILSVIADVTCAANA